MSRIVIPKQIYSYEQMVIDIRKLEEHYSGLVSSAIIGKSLEKRNIYAIKLGNGTKEIHLNGSHHAREWLTTSLLMHMIDEYCNYYLNDKKLGNYNVKSLLDNVSIWVVPMVNPDGVSLVQHGETSMSNSEDILILNGYEKSFDAWKANGRGVDLNRQYPADWEYIQNDPGRPAPSMYKGTHPLSEPETKALHDFTLNHNFILAASYHSSGEEIFWKYKSKGELLELAKEIATLLSEKTGYRLIEPGPDPSSGGFTDWFLTSLKKPAFTIEISPLVGPRPVPIENYDKIWNQNKEVGLLLATEALKLEK